MANPPLFRAERVRIDVGSAPTLEALSFSSAGPRLLVVGAARALFEATASARPVVHGIIDVIGLSPLAAVQSREVASVPRDPSLPAKWSPERYVTVSAELAGLPRDSARRAAASALEGEGLSSVMRKPLGGLSLSLRRATVLAAARATGASVLVAEDPTAGLPDGEAAALANLLVGRRGGVSDERRRVIVFADTLNLASALASQVDDIVVLLGSTVVARGTPSELALQSRTIALRIHGDSAAFAERSTARGLAIHREGSAWIATLARGQSTTDLLAAAHDAGAVIIELLPVPNTSC